MEQLHLLYHVSTFKLLDLENVKCLFFPVFFHLLSVDFFVSLFIKIIIPIVSFNLFLFCSFLCSERVTFKKKYADSRSSLQNKPAAT